MCVRRILLVIMVEVNNYFVKLACVFYCELWANESGFGWNQFQVATDDKSRKFRQRNTANNYPKQFHERKDVNSKKINTAHNPAHCCLLYCVILCLAFNRGRCCSSLINTLSDSSVLLSLLLLLLHDYRSF